MSQFDISDSNDLGLSLFKMQSRQNQQRASDSSSNSSSSNVNKQADDGIKDTSNTNDTAQAGSNVFSSPLDELKAFTTLALESLAQAAAGRNSEQFLPSKDTTPTPYGMCYIYVKNAVSSHLLCSCSTMFKHVSVMLLEDATASLRCSICCYYNEVLYTPKYDEHVHDI
jgi:hypothetical protein